MLTSCLCVPPSRGGIGGGGGMMFDPFRGGGGLGGRQPFGPGGSFLPPGYVA